MSLTLSSLILKCNILISYIVAYCTVYRGHGIVILNTTIVDRGFRRVCFAQETQNDEKRQKKSENIAVKQNNNIVLT